MNSHESFKTCNVYVFWETCLRDEEICFSHGKWLQNSIHSVTENWLYLTQPLESINADKISQKLQVHF